MKHKQELTEVVRARVTPDVKRRVRRAAKTQFSDEAQIVRDALRLFLAPAPAPAPAVVAQPEAAR